MLTRNTYFGDTAGRAASTTLVNTSTPRPGDDNIVLSLTGGCFSLCRSSYRNIHRFLKTEKTWKYWNYYIVGDLLIDPCF